MHKFKSLSKCINNNNSNNCFIKSSKYLQSTTRLLNNNLKNNVFNNNQVSNSLINSSLLQQYQKRDASFLSNIKSNFKYLLDSDPENAKLLEDFDRVFLNSRFKKQREEEERKKKELEDMMAEYSRAAEERARAEAHLSPEELQKKREEEQRLYEEILSQQEGRMGSRISQPIAADEESAQRILDMEENLLGNTDLTDVTPRKLRKKIHRYNRRILRAKLQHSLFDFDTAQDVKFYTPNGTDQEAADIVNRLKAIKERVKGKRPPPFEPDREEPTFEDCQDFYVCQILNIYQSESMGKKGIDYAAKNFMGIEEHIKLALGSLEPEFKFLEEVDKEARSLGIQYDNIDWESFKMDFFSGAAINQEAVESLLPKEYLEFLDTKLNVQYASEIEKATIEEEKLEMHEEELENQGLTGRSLSAEDNEKLYPVPSKPLTPEDLGIEKDPIHIRLFDQLLDKMPEEPLTKGYTNRFIQKIKRKVHIGNAFVLKHWDENMPGMSLDRLLVELRSKFLPNYIYHYLRGNLDQLKKYTDEEFLDNIIEQHQELEGENTILNHELIGVSKLIFHKFMATGDTTVLKVSLSCIHRVGLRDYNGHPVALSMEDRYGLYETFMTFYLSLYRQGDDQFYQNRFGWNVHYMYPSKSVKVLDLVPDKEWEQSKDWKVEQIKKERVEYYKQQELKEKQRLKKEEERLKKEEEKKAKELKKKQLENSNNNNNNNNNNSSNNKNSNGNNKSDQNKSKSK